MIPPKSAGSVSVFDLLEFRCELHGVEIHSVSYLPVNGTYSLSVY